MFFSAEVLTPSHREALLLYRVLAALLWEPLSDHVFSCSRAEDWSRHGPGGGTVVARCHLAPALLH